MGFDREKFKACDVMEEGFSIEKEFGKFDLIIASECLYYFTKSDLDILLKKFSACMNDNGIFYANMSTYHHELYQDYKETIPNRDGMTKIESSGTANQPLYVRLVRDKAEMKNIFSCFEEVATLRSVYELASENESLHYIGRKRK